MSLLVKIKTFDIKSKVGDKLKVRIEKIGAGEGADILYRIFRGEDRNLLAPDEIILFREELAEISAYLKKDLLEQVFAEKMA